MKIFLSILTFLMLCSGYSLSPSEAFDRLVEGNRRFCKNKAISPNQEVSRRLSSISSQSPFAVILACSDSRVAPEILFDQGIGDLFVVRVAGNVIDPLEMESILYAVKYLGSSCVLVMGHENCGAIKAVIEGNTVDIPFIAQVVKPSVLKAKQTAPKDVLKASTKINAESMADFIKQNPNVADLISKNKLLVRSAYYNFATGVVEIL